MRADANSSRIPHNRRDRQEYFKLTVTHAAPARYSPTEFEAAVLALRPVTAVFDCDGTIWSGDAGYGFMVWSIEAGLVSRNASDWIRARRQSDNARLNAITLTITKAVHNQLRQPPHLSSSDDLLELAEKWFKVYVIARTLLQSYQQSRTVKILLDE